MKLLAKLGDSSSEINVKRDGDRVTAIVDGREYILEVRSPEPGVFSLRSSDGQKHETVVSMTANGGSLVRIGGRDIEIDLVDPKRLRGSNSSGEHTNGAAEIKTAMPGKVVRILVSEDDAVLKGDGVIVVEAMKMQNEMKSPKDGVIQTIRFAEGDTVGAGDVLVVIE